MKIDTLYQILTNRIVLSQSIMFKLTSVIVLLSLLTAVVGWTWKKPIHKFDKVKVAYYLVGGLNNVRYV